MASETVARTGNLNDLDGKSPARELKPCSFPQKSTDKPGGGDPMCMSLTRLSEHSAERKPSPVQP